MEEAINSLLADFSKATKADENRTVEDDLVYMRLSDSRNYIDEAIDMLNNRELSNDLKIWELKRLIQDYNQLFGNLYTTLSRARGKINIIMQTLDK